ncbi:MAG: ferredoxin family protein [Clostridium sp.]|jgi:ferredoxin-like protein FixX|nr:ferredoxin family protein [Clostridium sp.]MBO6268012.1 ferredoxin family protein [Clostridium sp.]MBQ4150125.1 ferredoxin family protein [Clostridium sp.]MBQ5422082.1 ferredoxin family protein [Clostridium sp.]HAE81334.1 ferredoxin family protein [Lachnoclostridium sp.]
MKKMTIEDKLGLNTFHTDEENSHIDVDLEYTDEAEIRKLLLACPAECYKYEDGKLSFSWLGCLECGTCRVLSHDKIVKEWHHPMGEIGVQYRQG